MNTSPGHCAMFIAVLVIAVVGAVPYAQADANWPQFRGPEARGIAEGDALPVTWSATENVAWKTDIPGRGWSSPIVWGNKVFLTTAVNMGESYEPKKGIYWRGGGQDDAPTGIHQYKVYCLDLESGSVLWQHQVHEGAPDYSVHIKNSRASETPVTDGERVYFYFGNLGLYTYDLDGNPVWHETFSAKKTNYNWGTAASPVLHEDRIYITIDNDEDSYLLALDKRTGDKIWRIPRDEASSWSTPYIWKNKQRTEIVTAATGKVRSYDLNGKLLWSLTGMSGITIATPYADENHVYISSGWPDGDNPRPIYAIRPGASSDITLAEGETSNEFIAWSRPMAAPYNPSTLVYNDLFYVLYDRGNFACLDPNTGKDLYEPERLPRGAGFAASPWAYGGNIFCLSEDGVTYVLKAGSTFELLHTNTLADDDMGMATPAIAGDRLLLRTAARIYCIQGGS